VNHGRSIVIGLGLVFLLAGCSAPAPGAPHTSAGAQSSAVRAQGALTEEALKARSGLLSQYPDATIPPAAEVREVSLDDLPKERAACMTKQGFPTSVTADGGTYGFVPQGQDEAHQVAALVCMIKFPLAAKYQAPLSDAQYKKLYNYQTSKLTDCLKAHGFDVPQPPSFQTFKDTYGNANTWSPYANVNVSGDKWTQINQQCPQIPSDLLG
jgi:hypothetical protein